MEHAGTAGQLPLALYDLPTAVCNLQAQRRRPAGDDDRIDIESLADNPAPRALNRRRLTHSPAFPLGGAAGEFVFEAEAELGAEGLDGAVVGEGEVLFHHLGDAQVAQAAGGGGDRLLGGVLPALRASADDFRDAVGAHADFLWRASAPRQPRGWSFVNPAPPLREQDCAWALVPNVPNSQPLRSPVTPADTAAYAASPG